MKTIPKPIQTQIQYYLHKNTTQNHQINYYGPYNPQNTLNGYPRIITNILTTPNYKTKEQCTLITTERLTHPQINIQNIQTEIDNIIKDTITLTKTLKKTLKKEQHTQKQKILTELINTLTKTTKTLLQKQKTLKTGKK